MELVMTKIADGRKLLLTVVTWLLELTLKCRDKFRLRQYIIPSAICMFSSKKNPKTKRH